jgi:hypothetical protein
MGQRLIAETTHITIANHGFVNNERAVGFFFCSISMPEWMSCHFLPKHVTRI